MLNFKLILSFCFLIFSVNCLYEDQAGTYDWLVQFVGKPKSISYLDDGDSIQKIILSSEQNVLAMINGKNGVLGWRHVYEKSDYGRIDDVKLIGQRVVAVFGGGHRVQILHVASGVIDWETHISNSDPQKVAKISIQAGSIAVLTHNNLSMLSFESGVIKSSSLLKEGEVVGMVMQGSNGFGVVTKESSAALVITTYTNNHATSTPLASLWNPKSECTSRQSGSVVCIDQETSKLFSTHSSRTSQPLYTTPLTVAMKDAKFLDLDSSIKSGLDLIALKVNENTMQVYTCDKGVLQLKFTFNEALALQVFLHGGVMAIGVLKRLSTDKLQFEAYNLNDLNVFFTETFSFPNHHGVPLQMQGVSIGKDSRGKITFSMLLLCQDHALVFVSQSGKHLWTREESLSSIISSQLIDLPISYQQANIKEEFESAENIFEMFHKRITSQLFQLKTYIEYLKSMLRQFLQPTHHHHHHHHHQGHNQAVEEDDDDEGDDDDDEEENVGLKRDEFNLNKIIVAVTAVGKLFGIDATSGKTVWKVLIKDLSPFSMPTHQSTLPLLLQRATNHFPHSPVCTLFGVNRATGKHMLFSFHPISGKETLLSSTPSSSLSSSSSSFVEGHQLDYRVENIMLLEQVNEDFIHPLLLIDTQLKTHVYPHNATSLVHKLAHSLHTFLVHPPTNTTIGYKIVSRDQQLLATSTWSLNFAKNHKVSAVHAKHALEHVHSVGLPLEDRSVLYKYLNPNLVVIVTKEEIPANENNLKGSFNIYLVDAVSGSVVFQCSHKRSSGAVHVIHSENWVVYNYWNQKHRRNEMAVLELFEGTQQSNSTSFSSLHPPPLPIVLRQAYIFGAHISSMGVSLTEKGITSKEILFALETGGIIGLPKILIDARRPEVVSQESREEGLIPYMPELPRPWERMLSYNLQVRNIRTITTSPSGLESTSLLFSYGLDMFYTRLMPSKMFDVLKEDFDYFFISAVLAGMILTSLLTQKLAANKLLNRAWK